jgi:hypothetical protein
MVGKFYDGFIEVLKKYGLQVYYIILVLAYFLIVWIPVHFSEWLVVWGFLLAFAPFVLPVFVVLIFRIIWLDYKRQQDYWSTEHTVLEIRLPEEITQSPYAAELFFRVLYQTGEEDTLLHIYRGKTSPWFSLEIVSTEGVVKFYVWTRTRYKDIVKSQLYAHYPTVQVAEVPDYTLNFPLDLDKMDLWGVEQTLQKPDPYPIMTYVDWGLDKADTKEEFKVDPLNSIIEFFGSIGPGEHLWSQIIIRGHTSKHVATKDYHGDFNITQWIKEELKVASKDYTDEGEKPNFMRLPEGSKEATKAMQRKEFKQMFDVGIRTLYLAKLENKKSRNAGIPTMFRSFEHGSAGRGLNGFKPVFWIGPFDWPWQDFMGIRRRSLKTKFYNGYVTRQYFYAPNASNYIFLNTEELASIWHLPGKVAHTPTLARMPSRRSEAPANLPVGEGPINLPM